MIRQIEDCGEVRLDDYDEDAEEIKYVVEDMINVMEESEQVNGVFYCTDPKDPDDYIYFSNHEEYDDINAIKELIHDIKTVSHDYDKEQAGDVYEVGTVTYNQNDKPDREDNHEPSAELSHGAFVMNGDGTKRVVFHVSTVTESEDQFVFHLLVFLFCTLFTVYNKIRNKPLP